MPATEEQTIPACVHTTSRKPWLPVVFLVVLTALCFVPFAGKAFNIDEPLFLWAAKHIQTNFTDPYGFDVNWYGRLDPMHAVTKNPPLACYYIALSAWVVGWGEVALRLAFLLPTIALVVGTYLLAGRFCRRPLEAALAALVTPVVLVSGNSVMCDVMMLAFFVWAVYLWVRGLDEKNHAMLGTAALLIAASALSKYFGIALIPLLFLYTLVREKRLGIWALYFLIPVAVLGWYQIATQHAYDRGLLLDAGQYASWARQKIGIGRFSQLLTGFIFTGGCVASALFLAPILWSRRTLHGGLMLLSALAIVMAAKGVIGVYPVNVDGELNLIALVQMSVWAAAGISLLALAALDLVKNRDADSLLLTCWVAGTFIFASVANWSVNARSILPMVPAAGILMMRRLELMEKVGGRRPNWQIALPLALSLILSVAVTWSDCRFANTARTAADQIWEEYGEKVPNIWFTGHWGFQYYAESKGAKAVIYQSFMPDLDDLAVVPLNGPNVIVPSGAPILQALEIPSGPLGIMDMGTGAGFYADSWGPLPFALGSVDPETYWVITMLGN